MDSNNLTEQNGDEYDEFSILDRLDTSKIRKEGAKRQLDAEIQRFEELPSYWQDGTVTERDLYHLRLLIRELLG
jgi:hypothetical protein